MAETNYAVNHPLAVKLYSKRLIREALKGTYVSKFIGKSTNSVVQLKDETSKSAGDQITYGLIMQLNGAGVSGDGALEGNEESLVTYSDSLLLDQIRNGVLSTGKMSEQRVNFDVREEAMDRLKDWMSGRMDEAFFNQICGNTGQADTRYTGSNATIAPDTNHLLYGGGQSSEASVAATSTAIFSLDLLDKAVEKAKTLSPLIRPVRINGEDKFVCFLHPYQVTSLRTTVSTSAITWYDIQKAAMMGGQVSNNPIYTGALGEYNGVILHESTRIPSVVANSRRAVLCGAQAAVAAFGQNFSDQSPAWQEKTFDYGNKLGVAGSLIWGLKKTRFNSADLATITIPTYAVAS